MLKPNSLYKKLSERCCFSLKTNYVMKPKNSCENLLESIKEPKDSPRVPRKHAIKLAADEKGMAVIEALVLMIIFMTMFWYAIGFWGIVHTGVLQSISARNYAFETFRHRSNLWYFRDNIVNDPSGGGILYFPTNSRLHGVNSDATPDGDSQQYATERRIAIFQDNSESGRSVNEHNKINSDVRPGERNESVSVDPVWIRTQYGICLTADCEPI